MNIKIVDKIDFSSGNLYLDKASIPATGNIVVYGIPMTAIDSVKIRELTKAMTDRQYIVIDCSFNLSDRLT